MREPGRWRAAAAALAAAAYVLPLVLTLMADLGHGAHHLAEQVRERRQVAAALGLVHLRDADDRRTSARPLAASATEPGGFVHTHSGSTHSHDAATDALLTVSQQADDGSGEPSPPTVQLSTHVPGDRGELRIVSAGTTGPPTTWTSQATVRDLTPATPPPRA